MISKTVLNRGARVWLDKELGASFKALAGMLVGVWLFCVAASVYFWGLSLLLLAVSAVLLLLPAMALLQVRQRVEINRETRIVTTNLVLKDLFDLPFGPSAHVGSAQRVWCVQEGGGVEGPPSFLVRLQATEEDEPVTIFSSSSSEEAKQCMQLVASLLKIEALRENPRETIYTSEGAIYVPPVRN